MHNILHKKNNNSLSVTTMLEHILDSQTYTILNTKRDNYGKGKGLLEILKFCFFNEMSYQ